MSINLLIIFISIVSSALVVFIFRQYDKKNRNFEKIAKFSKVIKKELEDFAQERFQELKDFDNCIEVSFEKGKNILDDINKSVNSIEQRIDLLNKENDRISSFYKKIDMIDKEIVDINSQLNEISENKEYIDNVNSKLSGFKKQMAFVERDLNRIEDIFKNENVKALKAASDKIVKETGNDVKDVKKEIDLIKKEINVRKDELVKNVRESGVQLRDDLKATQDKLMEFTESQHTMLKENTEIFTTEISDIRHTIYDLKNNFMKDVESEFVNLSDMLDGKISEKSEDVNKLDLDFQKKLEDKINSYSGYLAAIEEKGVNLNKNLEISLDECKNRHILSLNGECRNLLGEIEKFGDKIKVNTVEHVKKAVNDVQDKYKESLSAFRNMEKEMSGKAADFEKFINDSSVQIEKVKSGINRDINEKIEEYDLHLKNINELGMSLELEIFNQIKSKFEQFKIEIYQNIDAVKDNMSKNYKDYEMGVNVKYEDSIKKIDSLMNNINGMKKEFDGIKDDFNTDIVMIKEKHASVIQDINEKSVAVKQEYIDEMEKIKKVVTVNLTKMKEYFNAEKSKFDVRIDKSIENLYKESDSKSNIISAKFEKTYKDFESKLLNVQDLMSGRAQKLEGVMINKQKETETGLIKNFENIKIELFDRHKKMDVELKGIESSFKDRIDDFVNVFNNTLMDKGKDNEQRLADLNFKIEEFNEMLDQSKDDLTAVIGEKENKMNEIKNNFEISLQKCFKALDQIENNLEHEVQSASGNIEKELGGQIKQRYNQYKTELDDMINKLKTNLNSELTSAKEVYEESRNEAGNEIDKIKNKFKNDMENWQSNILEIIKTKDSDIDEFKNRIFDNIEELNSQFKQKIDENNNDVDNYVKKLYDRSNAVETDLDARIKLIESAYYQKGEKLVIDNSLKLDDFIQKFNVVTKEFDGLKNKIDNEVNKKVEDGKNRINKLFVEGTENLNANYKDLENETLERLNGYKKELIRVQDNMKQIDDRYTSRFLEHANQLDKRIVLIENEVKNFEKSTNLFNRTDKLKEKLESDIKTMKEEMQIIRDERSEILKVEKKMLTIESLVASTHDKYRIIMDEKKKIENMETILEELRQISNSVDEKIDNIKTGKVMVENIETKINGLNTKIKNVEEYYDELNSKEKHITKSLNSLESMNKTADAMSGKMITLEKKYDDLDFKKATFEKSFKNFEKDANLITKSEKKVAEVIDKFKQMDSLIEDLEVRTDVINKHREWLVKAETQMVNLNSDTDNKIKMLKSLLNNSDSEKSSKNKTMNDQTKKETVLKLKKQGWTIDEIAKTCSLSAGEVEFILDLEHSKAGKR